MTEKDEAEFEKELFHVFSVNLTPDQRNIIIPKITAFITRKQQELVESILAEIPDNKVLDIKDIKILKQAIKDEHKYGI